MKKYTKGFTLIELLVVIAIIGILTTIVLSSLNSARTNAVDAKVKGQLFSIRNAAELYYTAHFNYGAATVTGNAGCSDPTGMFQDTTTNLNTLSVSANAPATLNTMVCNSNTTAYAVSDLLSSGKYWCIDSTGISKEETAALTNTDFACP